MCVFFFVTISMKWSNRNCNHGNHCDRVSTVTHDNWLLFHISALYPYSYEARRVDRSIVYHMAVDVLIIILQYLYGA